MNDVKTILFDLDGTLLPMDQDEFIRAYFKELSLKGVTMGFEPRKFAKIIMAGVEEMVRNDGAMTNEKRFWNLFTSVFGGDTKKYEAKFEEFYYNEFERVADVVQPTPLARKTVQALKEKGYELVLATNPIFPQVATYARMRWAGLDRGDFALVTTYENSRYAKPNLEYYREILAKIGADPQDCIMIGNDVQEDLVATEIGLKAYLVTDDLINSNNIDISSFRQGDRQDLLNFVSELPSVS